MNSKSRYGRTPLIDAATNKHVAIVELLLKNGADLFAGQSLRQILLPTFRSISVLEDTDTRVDFDFDSFLNDDMDTTDLETT